MFLLKVTCNILNLCIKTALCKRSKRMFSHHFKSEIALIITMLIVAPEAYSGSYKRLLKKEDSKNYLELIANRVRLDDLQDEEKSKIFPIIYQAVAVAESSLNPKAISNKNCMGLMQLEITTANDMGFIGENHELLNPQINIVYGVKYLRWVYKFFKGKKQRLYKTLDAYNRGVGNVTRFPYTKEYSRQRYVKRVLVAKYYLEKAGY